MIRSKRPRPRDLAQRIVDGLLHGYAAEVVVGW